MGAGRPFGTLRYDNEPELIKGIDDFFTSCLARPVIDADCNQMTDRHGNPMFHPQEPPTITGLARFLDITPQTLAHYGKEDKYFDTIHRARLRCLEFKEKQLYNRDGVQGAKFDLCNNSERMGGLRYADRQEVLLGDAPITFTDDVGI